MAIEKLGDVLLLERLAAGGMAEVFRAKQYGHEGFEKVIAVKRILPNYSAKDDFKAMFRQEANLSAQLQHPNIAQIYANGSHGDYLFIIMEFVDGKNLRQIFVKADKLGMQIPVEFACFVLCEAAKALDFAHDFLDEKSGEPLHIVHRDVNHQNIMLSYEGGVKVVDFGVAKAEDQDGTKTKAGVLKGKIAYMSPEQVRGKEIDRRTDIFSMGIVLWELLATRPLFMLDDQMATLDSVRACVVPPLSKENPKVPQALEKIVNKALAKDMNERYKTAKEFCMDLQRYLNQNHPNFIQSDVADYMKEIFRDEIFAEKIRKDSINQEAAAFLLKNPIDLRDRNAVATPLAPVNTLVQEELVEAPKAIGLDSPTIVSDMSGPSETLLVDNAPPGSHKSISLVLENVPLDSSGVHQVHSGSYPFVNTSGSTHTGNSGAWRASQSGVGIPSQVGIGSTNANSNIYSNAIRAHSNKFLVFGVCIVLAGVYFLFSRRQMLFANDSRYDAWSERFRDDFVQTCASSVRVNADVRDFCDCYATDVEEAHVLNTRTNETLTNEAALAMKNFTEFEKYMKSPKGSSALQKCEAKVNSQ